jgi:predicted XRE-type DNA-binding protein
VEEIKYLLEQILLNQKEHKEAIEALRKRIDELHDPVLQSFLEQAIQVKPVNLSPIQDLLNKANKKTS